MEYFCPASVQSGILGNAKNANSLSGPAEFSVQSARTFQLDRETVVRWLDMSWQPGPQLVIVEIGVQVRQDRSGRLDPANPCQGVVDAEMASLIKR